MLVPPRALPADAGPSRGARAGEGRYRIDEFLDEPRVERTLPGLASDLIVEDPGEPAGVGSALIRSVPVAPPATASREGARAHTPGGPAPPPATGSAILPREDECFRGATIVRLRRSIERTSRRSLAPTVRRPRPFPRSPLSFGPRPGIVRRTADETRERRALPSTLLARRSCRKCATLGAHWCRGPSTGRRLHPIRSTHAKDRSGSAKSPPGPVRRNRPSR
jgi:hypothetical protein